jgi:hypothetical protein
VEEIVDEYFTLVLGHGIPITTTLCSDGPDARFTLTGQIVPGGPAPGHEQLEQSLLLLRSPTPTWCWSSKAGPLSTRSWRGSRCSRLSLRRNGLARSRKESNDE